MAELQKTVPLWVDQRIHQMCLDCEDAWQAGRSPRIETYLVGHEAMLRDALFPELLRLEIEYRREAGDTLDMQTYQRRFDEYRDVVAEVFEESEDRADERPNGADESLPADFLPAESALVRVGRFRLVRMLGTGAFGIVWLAHDPQHDRLVALKLAGEARPDDDKTDRHFLREARAASGLRHPHIVPVLEAGRTTEGYYIVSEYVEGETLRNALRREERCSPARIARLIGQLADGLDYAHGLGIVHRDLKPENIMLDRRGAPQILDFGLAKCFDESIAAGAYWAGTLAYMSPEQLRGDRTRVDHRSDIWSLGVVMYELLTGRTPFFGDRLEIVRAIQHDDAPAPRKLDSSIPKPLDHVCAKCLRKHPAQRYPSARALADELRDLVRSGTLPDRLPAADPAEGNSPRRRARWRAAVAVCLVGPILGLLFWMCWTQLVDERHQMAQVRPQESETHGGADGVRPPTPPPAVDRRSTNNAQSREFLVRPDSPADAVVERNPSIGSPIVKHRYDEVLDVFAAPGLERQAVIEFDLSEWKGRSFSKATLQFYVTDTEALPIVELEVWSYNGSNYVEVTDFDRGRERAYTWKATFDTTRDMTGVLPVGKTVTIDVTYAVNSRLGPAVAFNLRLAGDPPYFGVHDVRFTDNFPNHFVAIAASDHPNETMRPALRLVPSDESWHDPYRRETLFSTAEGIINEQDGKRELIEGPKGAVIMVAKNSKESHWFAEFSLHGLPMDQLASATLYFYVERASGFEKIMLDVRPYIGDGRVDLTDIEASRPREDIPAPAETQQWIWDRPPHAPTDRRTDAVELFVESDVTQFLDHNVADYIGFQVDLHGGPPEYGEHHLRWEETSSRSVVIASGENPLRASNGWTIRPQLQLKFHAAAPRKDPSDQ